MLLSLHEILPHAVQGKWSRFKESWLQKGINIGFSRSDDDTKSVKKQYRKACLLLAPDRHLTHYKTSKECILATALFKVVAEAYGNYEKQFLRKH